MSVNASFQRTIMWLDAVLSIRFVVGDCSKAAPVREQKTAILRAGSKEGRLFLQAKEDGGYKVVVQQPYL